MPKAEQKESKEEKRERRSAHRSAVDQLGGPLPKPVQATTSGQLMMPEVEEKRQRRREASTADGAVAMKPAQEDNSHPSAAMQDEMRARVQAQVSEHLQNWAANSAGPQNFGAGAPNFQPHWQNLSSDIQMPFQVSTCNGRADLTGPGLD